VKDRVLPRVSIFGLTYTNVDAKTENFSVSMAVKGIMTQRTSAESDLYKVDDKSSQIETSSAATTASPSQQQSKQSNLLTI